MVERTQFPGRIFTRSRPASFHGTRALARSRQPFIAVRSGFRARRLLQEGFRSKLSECSALGFRIRRRQTTPNSRKCTSCVLLIQGVSIFLNVACLTSSRVTKMLNGSDVHSKCARQSAFIRREQNRSV